MAYKEERGDNSQKGLWMIPNMGLHKLRRQDFGPPTPFRSQVYYLTLCCSIDIRPAPSPLLVYVVYEWPLIFIRTIIPEGAERR